MTVQAPAIYAALAEVMADCTGIAKRDRNEQQRFTFRGIDAVLNGVGPVLRKHRVLAVPTVTSIHYEPMVTRNGSTVTSVRLIADYVFYATDGSSLTTTVAAEAFDSGDKATAKAMSVAMRTALIQCLALPTDERDPDADSYEQAPPVARAARTGNPDLDSARAKLKQAWNTSGLDWHAFASEFEHSQAVNINDADAVQIRAFLTARADTATTTKGDQS